MASITREQINKMNQKLKNGFSFDIQYFVYHKEKVATKDLKIDDNSFIRFRLMFVNEYKTVVNSCGAKHRQSTGLYVPCVHISKYVNNTSHGLGQWVDLGTAQKRQTFSTLQKLSEICTEEKLTSLIDEIALNNKNIL